ncbi:hypothetical protein P4C99_16800 [Pontiellaceae bacterium B1224]|nr:hypothetical protein [Pontiellaceae bacterium B1224]
MKKLIKYRAFVLMLFPMIGTSVSAQSYYGTNYVLSAPAPGSAGTTAVHMSTNAIVAWADGFLDVNLGTDVSVEWRTPEKALGPATGVFDDVVSLGRDGSLVLTFSGGIQDRPGADFVVFENGFSDSFLELAYVEVSSDGTNFVRFPNYSYTESPVPGFGNVETRLLAGLAGKYRQGYGTPFDLNELQKARDAILSGQNDFSSDFINQFNGAFSSLDFDRVTHVRIRDVSGDGLTSFDARGEIIYDPYPTTSSVGFDLEAIGVIHSATPDQPAVSIVSVGSEFVLTYRFDTNELMSAQLQRSSDLLSWTNAAIEQLEATTNGTEIFHTVHTATGDSNCFYRLLFNVP